MVLERVACPFSACPPSAGEHELWCTSVSILNLPPHERFDHENLLLVNVATNKAVGAVGMATIFSGADPTDGSLLSDAWSSPGAQLRVQRREIQIFRNGQMVTKTLVVYLFWFSADNPAAGKITSFPESTSAHLFCRGCLGDQRLPQVSVRTP